jgi:histidinol phosphatase-like PHP family hydrolase
MTDFVHLHVHSDFSLADAAVSVMRLADRAEELGMTHLALTDHGNMFGAMESLSNKCNFTILGKPRSVLQRLQNILPFKVGIIKQYTLRCLSSQLDVWHFQFGLSGLFG